MTKVAPPEIPDGVELRPGQRVGREFRVGGCKVIVQRVLRIEIEGLPREDAESPHPSNDLDLGPLPKAPDDRGLVMRLHAWLHKQRILEAISGAKNGRRCYTGYFNEDVAGEVVAWLESQAPNEETKGE